MASKGTIKVNGNIIGTFIDVAFTPAEILANSTVVEYVPHELVEFPLRMCTCCGALQKEDCTLKDSKDEDEI
jgi:hypothetical protein